MCSTYQPPLWVSWLYRQVKSSTKCNFSIFTYIWIQLEFEKQKRKKKLLTNYYTKLLKFCCSGHWDINHPTINSPFGDSFWHRLGLMQDQHVRVAYCKTWFAHQLGCLIYLGRDSYGPDHLIFEPYTCSKIIRPARKSARADMWHCISLFFTYFFFRRFSFAPML